MAGALNSIKQNIKKINIQAMNPGEEHRLFLCFFGGLVLGTILINMFGAKTSGEISIYSEYLTQNNMLNNGYIDKWDYTLYCFKNYIKEFLLVLLFNLTPFGKLFNSVYLGAKGVMMGILISAATLSYGAGGVFLYLISVFPHYFAYVPFIISCIYVAKKTSEKFRDKSKKVNIRALFIVAILAIVTAILEAYANYSLLELIYG